MTAVLNGTERRAAVAAWRAAAETGRELTGAELAAQFPPRSPRWGRDVIAEAKRQDTLPRVPEVPERQGSGGAQDTDALRAVEAFPVGNPHRDEDSLGDEPLPRQAERRPWYDTGIVLVVAAVAAAASYGHMAHVAALAGEPGWIAHLFPVTVDGLVLAALRRGQSGRWWLLLGLAVSVGANVLSQYPHMIDQLGPAVSAWPPLALYGTHRLLHRRPETKENAHVRPHR